MGPWATLRHKSGRQSKTGTRNLQSARPGLACRPVLVTGLEQTRFGVLSCLQNDSLCLRAAEQRRVCIFFHLQCEAVKRGKKAQEEVRERPGAAAQARPGPGAGRNHNGGRGLHIFWAPDPGLPTTLWGLSCHYLLCTEERPGSSEGSGGLL